MGMFMKANERNMPMVFFFNVGTHVLLKFMFIVRISYFHITK